MLINASQSLALGLAFFTIGGCVSEPGPGETPDTSFTIAQTCLRRDCGPAYDDCMDRERATCRACIQVCGGYCSCTSECGGQTFCRQHHCRDTDPCLDFTYDAQVGEPNPNVLRSCQAYREHLQGCGVDTLGEADCERYAATEDPEAIEVYDCLAGLECVTEWTCRGPAPEPELGAWACAAMSECGATTEDCEGPMAEYLGWLRVDVLEALQSCLLTPACDARLACFEAWSNAIEGP